MVRLTLRHTLLLSTAIIAFGSAQTAFAATDLPTTTTTYTTAQTGTNGTAGSAAATGNAGTVGTDAVNTNADAIILTNSHTITGGAGGAGGNSSGVNTTGANAAMGGAGITIDNASVALNNTATGMITGGAGADGGAGTNGDANGGAGSVGGAGVNVTGANAKVLNTGLILGGHAGNSGSAHGGGFEANNRIGGAGIILGAAGGTLNNSNTGTITGGDGGTGATVVQSGPAIFVTGTDNSITNAGTINGGTGVGVLINTGATHTTLSNSGQITSTIGKAVQISETLGAGGFSNTGTINSINTSVLIDNSISATRFDNTGTLSSNNGTALDVQGQFGNLINLGTVTSGGTAPTVILNADQTLAGNLILNGAITNTAANNNATALSIAASQTTAGNHAIINTGTITTDGTGLGLGKAVSFANTAAGTFENKGAIRGNIIAGNNAQTFINNAGTLIGNINLGDGNNNIVISGGTVTGNLTGGLDDDTVTLNNGTLTGDITLGDGNNQINLNGGNSTGNITTLAGNDYAVLNGGHHTGDITLGDGANLITLSAGTVTGNLTTGANADTLNLNGGFLSGAIDLGAGANTVNATQDYSFSSSRTLASSSTIDLNVSNAAHVTIANTVSGLHNLAIGSGSNLQFAQNRVVSGSLVNNGQLSINADTTLTVDSYNAANTGTLNILVTKDGNLMVPGRLTVQNGGADLSHGAIVFHAAPVSGLSSNVAGTFLAANNGGVVTLPTNMTDTSLLYNFTTTGDGTDHATVSMTRIANGLQNAVANMGNSNTLNVAAALDGTSTSNNPELSALEGTLGSLNDRSVINKTLQSVTPTVDKAAADTSNTVSQQSLTLTQNRLETLRTGVSSGDDETQHNIWAQPFATTVQQNERNGIAGYQADTYGLTVGADTDGILSHTTLGVALSYAKTQADSDNVNHAHSGIDSYTAQLYGDYDLGQQTFLSGFLGYGRNQIDSKRYNVGSAGTTASANYNSNQYLAALNLGRTFTPLQQAPSITLTPQVGLRYTHLTTDDFAETGAGGLNLRVATQDKDALELNTGAELAWHMATIYGTLVPSIHAGYTYDAIGDDLQTSSRFTGGGAAFATQGADPAQSMANFGAGIRFYSGIALDLSLQYDAQLKADYMAQSGYLRVTYKF